MLFPQITRKQSIPGAIRATKDQTGLPLLKKNLTFRDLLAMSVAAIIGAGIFSTIGMAASEGGPAVALLFLAIGATCSFSALCFAEFASRIPVSGSVYTYSYVTLGEIFAWMVGWSLFMEYSVGNITVAISWSDYFTGLISGFGLHIPESFTMDYASAKQGFIQSEAFFERGLSTAEIPGYLLQAREAWLNAPELAGFRLIADLPAFLIVMAVTGLVYKGITTSKRATNVMVVLKMLVILIIVLAGIFYIQPENWSPFAPHGMKGVMKGVSAVFFAFIGFEVVTTTAEECKNPERDIPRAILASLFLCALLYGMIACILTGMVSYRELAVGDPVALVFSKHGVNWASWIIAISALIAMTGVLLAFQIGQPRIWMAMSRDGLLPGVFSSIHKTYRTPAFSTLVAGVAVGIPALFIDLRSVTDLTSIGTFFILIIVCAGVLSLRRNGDEGRKVFRCPYINGKYWLLTLWVLGGLLYFFTHDFRVSLQEILPNVQSFPVQFPFWIFWSVAVGVSLQTYRKNWSLIPVLGLLTNLYLMATLDVMVWKQFLGFLLAGILIYFLYGRKYSLLGGNVQKSK